MTNPNPDFKEVKMQESTGRCICWDETYRTVYRRRFGRAQGETAGGDKGRR